MALYRTSLMLSQKSSTLAIPSVPFSATTLQLCKSSLSFTFYQPESKPLKTNKPYRYPSASNGLILTGFSLDSDFIGATFLAWASKLARNDQPKRFGHLPTGYLTWANASRNEETFFHPGFFDPGILLFDEATKQPFTTGEVLTLGGSPPTVPKFKGPVQVLVGGESHLASQGTTTCLTY